MYGISPLLPAYGRDYKSRKAALADINANKDFRTCGGPYTNLSDLQAMGKTGNLNVRSADQRKVWAFVIPAAGEVK